MCRCAKGRRRGPYCVGAREFFAAQHAGKIGLGQIFAQPSLFGAVADDEEAVICQTCGIELFADLFEQGHILFDRETADKAEDELVAVRPPLAVSGEKSWVSTPRGMRRQERPVLRSSSLHNLALGAKRIRARL